MNIIKMKCSHCGANLELDLDNLMAYCPYCGEKLLIDVGQLKDVLVEREKTKQREVDVKLKALDNEREANDNRYWLILIIICFTVMGIMAIAGLFLMACQ
jgi:DNA-directed RNA polymerase subunit RPC12/RpoP